ncbi:MAG: hypothetical protein Q8K26_03610 [Candidatus Gracilibacteria bacterium]|nr:hypothetical protein [Candidatus Gracilibacteria bacterium]
MKTLKTILATILIAITTVNTTLVVNAETTYTLPYTYQKALELVQVQAKAWYEKRVATLGKVGADSALQKVIDKLGVLQMQHKNNIRNYTILYTLRLYVEGLMKGGTTPVVTTPVVTTTPKIIDESKVKEIIKTIPSKGMITAEEYIPYLQQLKTLGFTDKEAKIIANTNIDTYSAFGGSTVSVYAKKDIYFCAPFTGDVKDKDGNYIWKAFGKYDAGNAFEDPEIRNSNIIYDRIVQGYYDTETNKIIPGLTRNITNTGYDEIKKEKMGYIRACAKQLMDVTQDEMKTLFAKMGRTYTIQTKPFWEINSTILDGNLGDWTKTLIK